MRAGYAGEPLIPRLNQSVKLYGGCGSGEITPDWRVEWRWHRPKWLTEGGSEASNSTGLFKTSFSNVPGAPKIAVSAARKHRHAADISVGQPAVREAAVSAVQDVLRRNEPRTDTVTRGSDALATVATASEQWIAFQPARKVANLLQFGSLASRRSRQLAQPT
jgi:hypothetical protein